MSQPVSDEELVAFLHGELDEARAQAVEAAINADPALAERAAMLDRQDDLLRAAFAPIIGAAVPDAMRDAVMNGPPAATVTSLDAFRTRRIAAAQPRWGWPQFGAMAASLAIGLIAGPALLGGGSPGSALVVASGGGTGVSPELAGLLNTAMSGEAVALGELGTARVAISFRDNAQNLCRQVELTGTVATSDLLACRAGSAWQVQALGQREPANGGMRTASGDAAPAVVAAVDAIIASDPLVGADERAALNR